MKSSLLRTLQAAMAVLGCSVLSWCVFQFASKSAQQVVVATSPTRPVTVEFTSLQTRDLLERVELTGTILPAEDVTVPARVDGQVTSVPVQLGDVVTKQQIIAEFDDTQLRVTLAISQTAVQSAQVQLRISQSRLVFPKGVSNTFAA